MSDGFDEFPTWLTLVTCKGRRDIVSPDVLLVFESIMFLTLVSTQKQKRIFAPRAMVDQAREGLCYQRET